MRKDIINRLAMIGGEQELINKSALARRLGCTTKTLNKYLASPPGKVPRNYSSKLDEFKGIIIDKVDNFESTATAVYRFIKTKGYTGKYGIVRKFVEEHVKEEVHKATIRFETTPGFQAQVDWKEKMTLISKEGEIFQFNVFLMILGYSRYKYFEVTADRSQKTLFRCMINAFHFFGGVSKETLFDNMATVVDRTASTFRAVVINKEFATFAKEMGFTVVTCRPYRPQTKGKVESMAKLIENLRPYNQEFSTYEEIQEIVRKFNEEVNNEKQIFLEDTPKILLKKETEFMNPVPPSEILSSYFFKPKEYKVSKESMVMYKGKKYSVPVRFIGKPTTVSEAEGFIHVYYTTDCIAVHRISNKFLNYEHSHIKEILKSDAFKYKTDLQIDEYIDNNLSQMDRLLITRSDEND